MREIKFSGTGCRNCEATTKLIEEVATTQGIAIRIEKVTDMAAILVYGITITPGVVVDSKVEHAGGVPTRDKIAQWRSELTPQPDSAPLARNPTTHHVETFAPAPVAGPRLGGSWPGGS